MPNLIEVSLEHAHSEIAALRKRLEELEQTGIPSRDAAADAGRDSALEIRFQRWVKEHVAAAYRGQLQDILSHVDDRATAQVNNLVNPAIATAVSKAQTSTRDALAKHDARVSESIKAAKAELEDQIASIVVRELTERQVIDTDGNLNHHMVAFALSKINGK